MPKVAYTSQTRLSFDIDHLIDIGVTRAYVTPFITNNESLAEPEVILDNLETIARKAEQAATKGLEVYPFFVTINHPEGNYQIPSRYRKQQNLDGTERPAFICFRDEVRQEEMIRFATKVAELGFSRIAFDDDLRDAFCHCNEHLNGFDGFRGKSRQEISEILNGVLTHPEHEQLREQWYNYKYEGMKDYAARLEQAVHGVNPQCRIGICNSAKRCQDFSGRDPWQWASLFGTDEAPVFVRLCGECYDDDLLHLAQSAGWHGYFNSAYPEQIERILEVTSVPSIGYRSPGAVLLESHSLLAATAQNTIHWAWTEEFGPSGLDDAMGPAKASFAETCGQVPCAPSSALALYIGSRLGPYLPVDISTGYGSKHDAIAAYNTTSLAGIPIVPTATIPEDQPAIMCNAYISRNMIEQIDAYVSGGRVAVLDAIAAQCYTLYGGQASFSVNGPKSLHRYELSPAGNREDAIADCPYDSIYLINVNDTQDATAWTGYDTSGDVTGTTTAIIQHGRGKLVILGYDISLCGSTLLDPRWRQRMLEMLSLAGVEIPTYWSGPQAVAVMYYENKVALKNYNRNQVSGQLIAAGKSSGDITLDAGSITFFDL